MQRKFLFILIAIIISLYLFQHFSENTNIFVKRTNENAYELINNSKYNPKKMFLSTWRLVKMKYYDPSLNKQDWYRWRARYIDKIKTTEDAYIAINSMLSSLNDPYSRFLNEKEYAQQNESIDSKITGIGVNITTTSGKILILSVLEDSPAEKNGIKSGDILTKVNGTEVYGLDLSEVAKLIRGKIGTKVSLEFMRNKTKFTKLISRDEIKIKNVKSKNLENNIGYIQISSFIGIDVANEFIEALEKTQYCDGLIIDLRDNTGGLMPNAIVIANMFINNGKLVSIVDRNGLTTSITAENNDYIIDKPTIVLINNTTASASEILSGALKDTHKAILVGEKTYGKGMIQKIFPMPNKTGMNLTIAKYLTPNGYDINKIGIKPDIKVGFTIEDYKNNKDPQLEKAKSILKFQIEQIMAQTSHL